MSTNSEVIVAGVTKLCHVRSNLNGVQQHQLILKRKKGAFFRKGSKFYICAFDIRVIVAVYVNSLPDDSSYHIRSKQDEHHTHREFENKCQVFWNHEP